jgi:hypothetical protein
MAWEYCFRNEDRVISKGRNDGKDKYRISNGKWLGSAILLDRQLMNPVIIFRNEADKYIRYGHINRAPV